MLLAISFWCSLLPWFVGSGIDAYRYDVSLDDPIAKIPHTVAVYYADFANSHMYWVCTQRDKWPEESSAHAFYEAFYAEGDWRRDAWVYLASATNEEFSIEQRLSYLRQLRELIGWYSYEEGRMPFCVALNRFQYAK